MHKRHDQLAKRLLVQALEGRGVLTTEQEISPDAQRFDGYFVPGPGVAAQGDEDLLYRLAAEPCAFEHFRDPPSTEEAIACLRKLLNARHVFGLADPPKPLPRLWILCAGHPRTALEAFGTAPHPTLPTGVLEAPSALSTGFVILSQLPTTRDTLLLRLMGKNETRRRAAAQLARLPAEARERRIALPVLLRFRAENELHPAHPADEEELLMETMDIVEAFENKLLGRGREEGCREMLLRVYRARFGTMPSEVRAGVERAGETELLAWGDLFATKSADEILAALTAAPR
jgi:hypothetical protein